jgi:formylglycine-generating enzyme required for sulfatase activity
MRLGRKPGGDYMLRLQHVSRLLLAATHLAATSGLILAVGGAAQAVDIDWVSVGDPGNACETQSQGCFGAVAYSYKISKYEVTNAQYAEFLNKVAADDTNGLYDPAMATPVAPHHGGITRSGSPGSYTYSTIAGREDMPVNRVSWYDSLRFANWLHNGQPMGAQDSTTTEDGAYDMSLEGWVRKTSAKFVLTSEDEWYKAAYYDAGSASYFDYPAGSDTETTCAVPGATANTANCDSVVGDPTDVGSYTGSASPNGTFDQGGNIWEWNEALIGSERGVRGGGFGYVAYPNGLAASSRFVGGPESGYGNVGFRVASIAESEALPSLGPMGVALLGGLVFGIAVGGLAVGRRGRV